MSSRHEVFISALGLALLSGCGEGPLEPTDSLLRGSPSFVVVSRLDEKARAERSAARLAASRLHASAGPDISQPADPDTFYLAVHKRELGQRFFLSGYIKQYFPGAVGNGAARSAGTRIVTLRRQNGRVQVVTADSISQLSDLFGGDGRILNSFPVVAYPPFDRLPGSGDYVLIDPGDPKSQVSLIFGDGWGSYKFNTELTYLQNLRKTDPDDGVTWEQVLTGYATRAIESDADENAFRGAATIGMGLRRYQEGKGFGVIIPDERGWPSHYFLDGPRIVKNEGRVDYVAAHWNVNDPARTIDWIVSPSVPAKYQGAVIAAIESWNDAFAGLGRKVVTARMATADESFADDDKNYIIYDPDPTLGFAFANWRTNPNTGEIRGASVYINAGWFQTADVFEMTPPLPTTARRAPAPDETRLAATGKTGPRLLWKGVADREPLCELHSGDRPAAAPIGMPGDTSLTAKEQAQHYIRHVITHEVGHCLGLRHNFKGSLGVTGPDQPGSTVMDYQSSAERILLYKPGPYDIAAIKLLYGMSTSLPTQPFCTDDGTRRDPECQTFDSRKDPLEEYYKAIYEGYLNDYLNEVSDVTPNNSLNNVLMFLRAGKDARQRQRAWDLAVTKLSVKTPLPMMAGMRYGERKDFIAQRILRRLWMDPSSLLGNITAAPPATDAALVALYYQEIEGSLLNEDGIRSYETRRLCVDILKKFQNYKSQAILQTAAAKFVGELATLSGDKLLQHRDLIARIDRALTPYFNP